jgi:hypothetical protein
VKDTDNFIKFARTVIEGSDDPELVAAAEEAIDALVGWT